jgi:very-short-patch-repair endonuclease
MGTQNDLDLRIAALADAQHGVVARRQLLDAGLSAKAIGLRIRAKRLRPLYRGVYAAGHRALTRDGRWMAAVLACGDGALLSHFDAAALHDLAPNRGARIHVTRPSTAGRAPDPKRIHLHRVGTFRPWEATVVDDIPVTTTSRTLLDIARHLHPAALEEVVERAIRRHRFDLHEVSRSLAAHARQPGAPRLRRLLDDLAERDAARTRSAFERDFLALCHDHGLPRPTVNAQVEGLEVDMLWSDRHLIVELDGYAHHGGRAAFERDRDRDQRLALAGYTVVRVTYRQLNDTPDTIVHRLRRLLQVRDVSW